MRGSTTTTLDPLPLRATPPLQDASEAHTIKPMKSFAQVRAAVLTGARLLCLRVCCEAGSYARPPHRLRSRAPANGHASAHSPIHPIPTHQPISTLPTNRRRAALRASRSCRTTPTTTPIFSGPRPRRTLTKAPSPGQAAARLGGARGEAGTPGGAPGHAAKPRVAPQHSGGP